MAKKKDKDKKTKSKPKTEKSKPKKSKKTKKSETKTTKSKKKAKSKSNKNEHVVSGSENNDRIVQTNPSSGIAKYVLAGLVIVALAVIAVFAMQAFGLMTITDEEPQTQEFSGEVAATVGGEDIYVEQLERRHALFQVTANPMITQQQVLEFLIEEEVLRQEAESLGIDVSEEELSQAEQQLLTGSGMTREELSLQLSQQGASYDDLLAYYSAGIRSTELAEQEIFSDVPEPTTEEARAFYDENQEQFITPNTADVRQIILAQGEGEDRSEESQQVLNRLEDGDDFCDLVAEFSDDPAGAQNCGEQSYANDQMTDPQLSEAAFALETGEVEAVNTQQGIFILEKLGETEEEQQSFEDVEQQVLEQLENQRLQEAYRQYVDDLLDEYGFEILVELEEQQQLPFEIQ